MNLQDTLSRGSRRFVVQLAGIVTLVGLALSFAAAPIASADGGREIEIEDKCDPATFDAVLGPGACVGDGDVTFEELMERVNPEDGGHGAWRFDREELKVKAGEAIRIHNVGGEFHTFTKVLAFGGGIVPELNHALPEGTPMAIPADGNFPGPFLAPGQTLELSLPKGQHLFYCAIHPWMQTPVTVR
jgi:plastocyanin